jgi:hypothetical protein
VPATVAAIGAALAALTFAHLMPPALLLVRRWQEHLRQHHERLTGTDRAYQQRANALAEGDHNVTHLIPVEIPPADEP